MMRIILFSQKKTVKNNYILNELFNKNAQLQIILFFNFFMRRLYEKKKDYLLRRIRYRFKKRNIIKN